MALGLRYKILARRHTAGYPTQHPNTREKKKQKQKKQKKHEENDGVANWPRWAKDTQEMAKDTWPDENFSTKEFDRQKKKSYHLNNQFLLN